MIQDLLNQFHADEMNAYLSSYTSLDDEKIMSENEKRKKQAEEEIKKLNSKLDNLNLSRKERMKSYFITIEKERLAKEKAEQERINQINREKEARKRAIELEKAKRERAEEERLAEIARKELEEIQALEKIQQEKRKLEHQRLEAQRLIEEKERQMKEKELAELRKQQEERKQAIEDAQKAKEAAEKAQQEEQRKKEEAKKKELEKQIGFSNPLDIDAEFKAQQDMIKQIKEKIVIPVSKNPQLKKLAFSSKIQIRPKLGQLNSTIAQAEKIFQELVAIINKNRQIDTLLYLWSLNFYCKALIDQAESEIAVSVNRAQPLALLTIYLLNEFPEMKDLMIARFAKKCPYLIGYTSTHDTEEGRVRMGWRRTSDNKWEEEQQYAERMAGIASVWAAITILPTRDVNKMEHLYPISNSWKFCARMCNIQPAQSLTNAHYAVVAGWWDVASSIFVEAYGRQGEKMLRLLSGPWTKQVHEKRYPAALRLLLLGEEWVNSGKLKALKPMTRN